MTTPVRRRLADHITDALTATAERLLRQHNGDPALREALARWMETAHERITVELIAERTRKGRPDPRSLVAVASITTAEGVAELCRVRVRELVDEDGWPIDARRTFRDLHDQVTPIPDDLSSLDEDGGDRA